MEKLFLSYSLSLLAKERGFNEECIASYIMYGNHKLFPVENNGLTWKGASTGLPAPTQGQIMDWFRRKHHFYIEMTPLTKSMWMYNLYNLSKNGEDYMENDSIVGTYKMVLNKAIEHVFNLIKVA